MSKPTVGSLFSGIGGMDLGLERAGFEVKWQVEIDDFCQRVLAKHWPHVKRYGDIRDVIDAEPVDLICGGFPCQPVSVAGQRRAQEDERWLWPEYARLVRLLRPRFILVENVPGLLTAGFGDVLGDLAEIGYDAEWQCISAASFGAPHLRERLFVVAYPAGLGCTRSPFPDAHDDLPYYQEWDAAKGVTGWEGWKRWLNAVSENGSSSHADGAGWADIEGGAGSSWTTRGNLALAGDAERWLEYRIPEPIVLGMDDGLSSPVDRNKSMGNAVVPQVIEAIGRRLMEVLS